MRSPLALLTIALLCLGAGACGGAGKGTSSASQASSNGAAGGATAGAAGSASGAAQGQGEFRGDGDDDDGRGETSISEGGRLDSDADSDNDYRDIASRGYHDKDDSVISAYGQEAGATDRQALTAAVKRYHAAAVAGDGARACAMIKASFAKAIPEDYGRPSNPAYLRGTTCSAVMSGLFKHEHRALSAAFEVTGVRVAGRRAYILLGSRTTPASYLILEREGGAWQVVGLLGAPLP
jgi:hypothetical protein